MVYRPKPNPKPKKAALKKRKAAAKENGLVEIKIEPPEIPVRELDFSPYYRIGNGKVPQLKPAPKPKAKKKPSRVAYPEYVYW